MIFYFDLLFVSRFRITIIAIKYTIAASTYKFQTRFSNSHFFDYGTGYRIDVQGNLEYETGYGIDGQGNQDDGRGNGIDVQKVLEYGRVDGIDIH